MLVYLGLTIAVLALVAALLAGLGHRWQWWSFATGFMILKWAVYLAMPGLVIAAIAMFLTRPATGQSGFAFATLAVILTVTIISVPLFWLNRARHVPPIHDITTDTQDPPQFVTILPLRQAASNPAQYGGIDVAIQQQEAYPDINSLLLARRPEQVFEQALGVVELLGWDIIAEEAEQKRIEATDTTFWFGFRDDIVIRIRAMDGGSRVDIRSVSREGISDVGTNARRIRSFLQEMKNVE